MVAEETPEERQERLRAAGAWLRNQRETRDWSGSDLARRLGVNQVRISAYERGQYEAPSSVAQGIADAFELPVIEVRRKLGLWVPSEIDQAESERYVDPAQLADSVLLGELIRRFQQRTDLEILEVYPHRSDVPGELWEQLISRARSEIFFGGYTNYFFWSERARFSETLRAKAEAGTRIRFLVGDTEHEVTHRREQIEKAPLAVSTRIRITLDELDKLGPVPGLEVRFSALNAEAHVSRSIFRFDDDALICEHIAERLGHGSLTYHLRRMQKDGPFDQYVAHAEHLWEGGRAREPA